MSLVTRKNNQALIQLQEQFQSIDLENDEVSFMSLTNPEKSIIESSNIVKDPIGLTVVPKLPEEKPVPAKNIPKLKFDMKNELDRAMELSYRMSQRRKEYEQKFLATHHLNKTIDVVKYKN